jgi:alkylhydroperoxidase family enzyme
MDMHAAVGGKVGLSEAKILAALMPDESNELSERERIALEYADRVSATPVDVPDEFFEKLENHFSEREILELTSYIAHENYNAKMNRPLRVEANHLCQLPLSSRTLSTTEFSDRL